MSVNRSSTKIFVMRKSTFILFILILITGWQASGQTTLERNSNFSSDKESAQSKLSRLTFVYSSRQDPNAFLDPIISGPGFVADSARSRQMDSLIAALRARLSQSTTAEARLRDSLVYVNSLLQKNLEQQTLLALNQRLKMLEKEMGALSDSVSELQFNTRIISNYAWDIFSSFDSAKEVVNPKQFFDSLNYFRTKIDDFHHKKVSKNEDSVEVMVEQVQNLTAVSLRLADSVTINQIQVRVARSYQRFQVQRKELESLTQAWNSFITRNIKVKEAKKVEVTALPFFNAIPGLKDMNGSISVFGNSSKASKGVYREFGGFTGILGTSDELSKYSLFIPESSTYGFFLKNNFSFDKQGTEEASPWGINLSFHYLGKKLKVDTAEKSKPVLTSLFQMKMGLEYVLVPSLFSVYTNVNAASFMTNRAVLKDSLGMNKSLYGFVDFGTRMLLEPKGNNRIGDWKLYFDLNFIINSAELKGIAKSNDFVIPNFRVGLRTELGRQ